MQKPTPKARGEAKASLGLYGSMLINGQFVKYTHVEQPESLQAKWTPLYNLVCKDGKNRAEPRETVGFTRLGFARSPLVARPSRFRTSDVIIKAERAEPV